MKTIKLSGKESSVVRAVDFATGTSGSDLLERTRLEQEELVSVLNGLMEAGFLECTPYRESITEELLGGIRVEVNPSYAHDLKAVLYRRGT